MERLIEALRSVALEVVDIAKRKDSRELWDTGENLDTACENCHRSYWYRGRMPSSINVWKCFVRKPPGSESR
jgi:hypothetical protein